MISMGVPYPLVWIVFFMMDLTCTHRFEIPLGPAGNGKTNYFMVFIKNVSHLLQQPVKLLQRE
jgi:hypothetical protein